jgi:hypothetical protein
MGWFIVPRSVRGQRRGYRRSQREPGSEITKGVRRRVYFGLVVVGNGFGPYED